MVNWWKKLKYWQKGGVIGILFGFLVGLIMFLLLANLYRLGFALLILHMFIFCTHTPYSSDQCAFLVGVLGWLIFPIFYGIVGVIIGFIIGKIKKNNR